MFSALLFLLYFLLDVWAIPKELEKRYSYENQSLFGDVYWRET